MPSSDTKEALNEQTELYCNDISEKENHCPPHVETFMGYKICWEPTPAGHISNNSCPPVEMFVRTAHVYKECWPNATWYSMPGQNTSWTNYINCFDNERIEFMSFINELNVIGYSISLVAVFVSLVIFLSFRSLKCTRIRIHIQLFLSFVMNNMVFILWYVAVIPNTVNMDPILCSMMETLRRYFMVANYMWMFCESLYLHISLVKVFVRDDVAWIWFQLIGWGLSFVIIFTYYMVRMFYYGDNQRCWMDDSPADVFYILPVCITLILSLGCLFNVLRVILKIMRTNTENPATTRVKKAVRATFILLPLFGLQYFVIPFRPSKGSAYEHLYEYISVFVVTLQGFWVAALFCFANRDVHQAIAGCATRRLSNSRWGGYLYTAPASDSAGVYVINSNNTNSVHLV